MTMRTKRYSTGSKRPWDAEVDGPETIEGMLSPEEEKPETSSSKESSEDEVSEDEKESNTSTDVEEE